MEQVMLRVQQRMRVQSEPGVLNPNVWVPDEEVCLKEITH